MALVTFAAVTNPKVANIVVKGGTAAATTGASPSMAMRIGDKFLIFVGYNSSTVSVSGVTNTGTALAWSRLGAIQTQGTNRGEIWVSTASSVVQVVTVTVNFSGAVTSIATICTITNNPGAFDAPVLSSGSGISPTGNGPVPTTPNGLLIMAETHANTGVSGAATGKPAIFATPLQTTATSAWASWVVQDYAAGTPTGATPSYTFGNITSAVWFVFGVNVQGPTVQLDDYAFQLRDDGSGVLLNDPNDSVVPIYDINQVQGIDTNTVNSSEDQIDGAHGSYVSAKFYTGKTVVLDGVLYASLPLDETLIDNLKYNWRPSPNDTDVVPFMYKLPGKAPRYLSAKPILASCDNMTPERSWGKVPLQFQFKAADPRAYGLARSLQIKNTPTTGVQYDDTLTNNGNVEAYPLIYLNITPGEAAGADAITIANLTLALTGSTPSLGITIDTSKLVATIGGTTKGFVLDLAGRSLKTVGGGSASPQVDVSFAITQRFWWYLLPGANAIQVLRGPNGSSTDGFASSFTDTFL
jgi:hypothetical protein